MRVCVGIAVVALNSLVCLHAGYDDAGKVERVGKIAPTASPPSGGAVAN